MNIPRRRRLLWVLCALTVAVLATWLTAQALQRNVAYLYTPTEVLSGQAGHATRFRLGGFVARDSVRRQPGSLESWFIVTDGQAQIRVRSDQTLPDLFREGQGVLVMGHRQGDYFLAEQVLAKHDETYMPAEVAAKLQQQASTPAGTKASVATHSKVESSL